MNESLFRYVLSEIELIFIVILCGLSGSLYEVQRLEIVVAQYFCSTYSFLSGMTTSVYSIQ